ncbi:hypothetical protein ZWY2020_010599 [Hordeum vulgare]|nr:hypothetical protein ZWY2020_010599 [Hordeum vulgare]
MALHRFYQRPPSSVSHLVSNFRNPDSPPFASIPILSRIRRISKEGRSTRIRRRRRKEGRKKMVPVLLRTILVTVGAAYIGGHTVLQLLLQGFRVLVVDSLDNASEEAIGHVRQLANNTNLLDFRKVDLRDKSALDDIFSSKKDHIHIHMVSSNFQPHLFSFGSIN